MSGKSLFCIAQSESQASEIVSELKSAGFTNNEIASLLPDKTGTRDFAHERHTKAPEGAATGGLVGGVIFAGLGWLAGIGSLAIPGLGPFIAAGPIMGALSAGAIGAATGALTGGLIGLRHPEYEARRYAGRLRDGNILLSVHCENQQAIQRAKTVLERANVGNIASGGESKIPGAGLAKGQEPIHKAAAENPA
jgi:hypothetical protein